jgi:hypothetical protein
VVAYNADVDREATTPAGKDLVAGSGIEFEERALSGDIAERWRRQH